MAKTIPVRNVHVAGKRTSMRLEPAYWTALEAIAKREGKKVGEMVALISQRATSGEGLTRAVRVFCLTYAFALLPEEEGISLPVRPVIEPRQARPPSLPIASGQRVRRRA